MLSLHRLLATACLGTEAVLLLGWAALGLRAPLTPQTTAATLERVRHFSPDPVRRREASLLLLGPAEASGNQGRVRQLLRHQGWGSDPLAALVLKLDARAAEALGRPDQARTLWGDLLRRFPDDPASADALYSLGRRQPQRRAELLRRFPAHPAALAAALEAGPGPAARLAGTLHLARWGARWPGAQERLRQVCATPVPLSPDQRGTVASALAELGDGQASLACLKPGSALTPAAQLGLGRSLLRGEPQQAAVGIGLLVALANQPAAAEGSAGAEAAGGASAGEEETREAVRLLAGLEGPEADAALSALPGRWRSSAPLAARRALASRDPRATLEVLRRWPADPASWDLQWEHSRRLLLEGQWSAALSLLEALDPEGLPPPLAARLRFWQGYVQLRLGRTAQARATWQTLRNRTPGGYYGWRAAARLGQGEIRLQAEGGGSQDPATRPQSWQPLESGDPSLDRLWRLDQRTEAWESWRSRRQGRRPRGSRDLLLEGRLRQGVGDDWTGLGQLEQALLSLPSGQCGLAVHLERHLHPRRFPQAFAQAAERHGLAEPLLLGLAKQESRFTPGVRSAVGAVGLMQLMPETAAELAGGAIPGSALEEPQRNADLGSLYLRQLLGRWQGNPLLTVASYNAGPGAVEAWIDPRLGQAPELWVEAIPYPETRLYVKKVLGNVWTYQEGALPRC